MSDAGAAPGQITRPVDAFLAALASGTPAPGGGAAAALAGALAAALVAMVCRVTVARDRSAMALDAVASRADQLRRRLAGLVDDDVDAYRRVIEARRLGAAGRPVLAVALTRATEVPLALMTGSRDVLRMCLAVGDRARQSALSDLAVAGSLAWGALEAGAVTAIANLKELTDTEFVQASERAAEDLLAEGERLRRQVAETIAARMPRLD